MDYNSSCNQKCIRVLNSCNQITLGLGGSVMNLVAVPFCHFHISQASACTPPIAGIHTPVHTHERMEHCICNSERNSCGGGVVANITCIFFAITFIFLVYCSSYVFLVLVLLLWCYNSCESFWTLFGASIVSLTLNL